MSSNRLVPIGELRVPPAPNFTLPPIPGFSFDTDSKFRPLPATNQVFVEMNSAAHTRVPRDKIGQIFTTALAGCTGIAAIAKTPEDTLAGVSRFDAVVDGVDGQRREGVSPSEAFLRQFMKVGTFLGAHEFELHVVYAAMHEADPTYGQRPDDYGQWHFLDQLQTFGERTGAAVTLQPYEGIRKGHTLVANVAVDAQTSIEFI
jgi:hypothetical protein